MSDTMIPPDLELYLTQRWRDDLAAAGATVFVSNREPGPDEDVPFPWLIVRDDGGPKLDVASWERTVGVSVLAGTKNDPKPAGDLARLALALANRFPTADPANPIAAVTDSNGPYWVAESAPAARSYFTATFVVSGEPL